ncbi:hypothetical protein HDU77_002491 [Chytriomyces hyalinus]|nr:hypothetical protein HDU77_002491 [Chytriomyces hyalinus]
MASNIADLLQRLKDTQAPTQSTPPQTNPSNAPSIDLGALKALAASLNATAPAIQAVPTPPTLPSLATPTAQPQSEPPPISSTLPVFDVSKALAIPLNASLISQVKANLFPSTPSSSESQPVPQLASNAFLPDFMRKHQTPPNALNLDSPKFSPALLRHLADMSEDARVQSSINALRSSQRKLEVSIAEQRRIILERHDKAKQQSYAAEIMGKDMDEVSRKMEANFARDLDELDKYIYTQLMDLLKRQQHELEMIKVPFFRSTTDPTELAFQKKILEILSDAVE